MAKRYDPTAYLYTSARLRAMENALVGKERLARLAELSSSEEILRALVAEGVAPVTRADGTLDGEAMLEGMMLSALATVRESVPDPDITLFIQYPYDCNNVKVLEKCRIRGISPEGLLSHLGSIAPEALTAALQENDLSLLPHHMREALPAAREAFAKTRAPREIDLHLDRALFLDMADAAAPFPLAARLVATRIDLINTLTFLRLCDGGEVARALLVQALLPGGTLPVAQFVKLLDGGAEALGLWLGSTALSPLFAADITTHAARERAADDLLMRLVREAKGVTFGAEVPIAYLLATEVSVKNLRILMAFRDIGRTADPAEGGLRESYV